MQCRQKNQKCDEGKPCASCKESNVFCEYKCDCEPKKMNWTTLKIVEYLEIAEKHNKNLDSMLEILDRRLRAVERVLSNHGIPHETPGWQSEVVIDCESGRESDTEKCAEWDGWVYVDDENEVEPK